MNVVCVDGETSGLPNELVFVGGKPKALLAHQNKPEKIDNVATNFVRRSISSWLVLSSVTTTRRVICLLCFVLEGGPCD